MEGLTGPSPRIMATPAAPAAHMPTHRSYMATGLHVLREEGLAALYRGAFFRCVVRVPLGLSLIAPSSGWARPRVERAIGVL